MVLIAATSLAGAAAAQVVARCEREDDPQIVVVDEVVGQWLSLLLLPDSGWKVVVAAFLAFRAMDILKPFPAGWSERLPGGVGIVADDLVAGVYANVLIRLLLLIPAVSAWVLR